MRYIVSVFFVLFFYVGFSQKDSLPPAKKIDSLSKAMVSNKLSSGVTEDDISIKDYKIISFTKDTTFVDTTLTLQKEYKYNYLRKDNFESMSFANIGRPSNSLGVNFQKNDIYPQIGAKALHRNYWEKEEIEYYHVPTPLTELMFKTTRSKGQLLDGFLTFNTSRNLNFSIGYKGFRSLGKYRYNQASSGNFTTTVNYFSDKKRYSFRAHIAAQDIVQEESGGLADKEAQFESGEQDFKDRVRLDAFFADGETTVLGKRYFLEQQYRLLKKENDSGKTRATSLTLGHLFSYETKYFQFKQDAGKEDYFGSSFASKIHDKGNLKTTYNQFNVVLDNKLLGEIKGYINLYNYNYFFNSILLTANGQIPNQLKGNELALGATYAKRIGGFNLKGEGVLGLTGDLNGNLLNIEAQYNFNENNEFRAALNTSSKMPNFNFLLHQSEYENYNWYNADFNKEKTYNLFFQWQSKVFGSMSANITALDNYTYFASTADQAQRDANQENAFIKPIQDSGTINYVKLKYNKEFKKGYFALDNTFMYQTVAQDNSAFNVPQFVTRNTLYFFKNIFKGAMFLQTGVTFKYFTEYNMNAYNPALGEFYSQSHEKLGGYPMFDFFINGKVKQTRIYLKAEHFNSSFTGYKFYAAPNYPYRDFTIRFGVVWNFFS